MRELHVVYTDFGDHGWGISSPQIPNLVGGRRSIATAMADTPMILAWCGIHEGSYTLHRHEQKYAVSPDGHEFLIRFAEEGSDERVPATGRALYSAETGEHLEDMPRMPKLQTGEHLVIAVLASDRLGWILDQLAPGEGAYLQYYAGEDAMYGVPMYNNDLDAGRGTLLEKLELTRESTVREMIDRIVASEVTGLRVAIQHQHETVDVT